MNFRRYDVVASDGVARRDPMTGPVHAGIEHARVGHPGGSARRGTGHTSPHLRIKRTMYILGCSDRTSVGSDDSFPSPCSTLTRERVGPSVRRSAGLSQVRVGEARIAHEGGGRTR